MREECTGNSISVFAEFSSVCILPIFEYHFVVNIAGIRILIQPGKCPDLLVDEQFGVTKPSFWDKE